MLLAAQCHLGSKNLQVHMEPYLWKTRPDGINVLNISKTWYVKPKSPQLLRICTRVVPVGAAAHRTRKHNTLRYETSTDTRLQGEDCASSSNHRRSRQPS